MKQLFNLILIQFKVYLREPEVMFWGFVFPILMAWGLGIAFMQKDTIVRQIAIVGGSGASPKLDHVFSDTAVAPIDLKNIKEYSKIIGNSKAGNITYKFVFVTWDEAITKIKRGEAALILVEQNGKLYYHFDPSNPEAQAAYMQLSAIINDVDVYSNAEEIRPLDKKGTRYIDFLIPGLIALNLMSSAMWSISYSLIEMRTKKLLRRMVVTPMKKSMFLLSQVISRIVMSAIEAIILLLFAWWYFDITIQGSMLALISIFIAGNIAFIGLAILISSRTASTQVGNALINVVVMPMMVCSGIFFSYQNFPDAVIPYIQHLPLTMIADSIRSIFIEGAGLQYVASHVLILGGFGTICFFAGLKMYKWY